MPTGPEPRSALRQVWDMGVRIALGLSSQGYSGGGLFSALVKRLDEKQQEVLNYRAVGLGRVREVASGLIAGLRAAGVLDAEYTTGAAASVFPPSPPNAGQGVTLTVAVETGGADPESRNRSLVTVHSDTIPDEAELVRLTGLAIVAESGGECWRPGGTFNLRGIQVIFVQQG